MEVCRDETCQTNKHLQNTDGDENQHFDIPVINEVLGSLSRILLTIDVKSIDQFFLKRIRELLHQVKYNNMKQYGATGRYELTRKVNADCSLLSNEGFFFYLSFLRM